MTCLPCPADRLCPKYGVTATDVSGANPAFNCPDGYVCLGGAIDVSKNDNVTVRLCSIGYYCALSTTGVAESPCPINYYNKALG